MNEEQGVPEEAPVATQETSKVLSGDGVSTLNEEFENDKIDEKDYYAVDDPKKGALSSIGDGEMLNEGTVGMGDISEENPFTPGEPADDQDKPE